MGAGLNEQIEAGIDPRAALREEQARNAMTVARAHELYMIAVREGRSSRANGPTNHAPSKTRKDVQARHCAGAWSTQHLRCDRKRPDQAGGSQGQAAKVRANWLAAELKVFFGGRPTARPDVGLTSDPSCDWATCVSQKTPGREF
jgi:hypothetical protein